MTDMDEEIVRKGLIDAFELILKLDQNPEMLKKLPKKSIWIKQGKRNLFVPESRWSKVVVL